MFGEARCEHGGGTAQIEKQGQEPGVQAVGAALRASFNVEGESGVERTER